jgi:hypothetical protein
VNEIKVVDSASRVLRTQSEGLNMVREMDLAITFVSPEQHSSKSFTSAVVRPEKVGELCGSRLIFGLRFESRIPFSD